MQEAGSSPVVMDRADTLDAASEDGSSGPVVVDPASKNGSSSPVVMDDTVDAASDGTFEEDGL